MFSFLYFILIFVVVYFAYYFIFDDMLKKEKYTKIFELVALTKLFKLDKKKMNYRKMLNGVAFINAFILAFIATLVDIIPLQIIFKLLIAFVLIWVLIISLYYMYGKYLNKKWGKEENGNK